MHAHLSMLPRLSSSWMYSLYSLSLGHVPSARPRILRAASSRLARI